MTFETIRLDRDSRGIVTITLNRPDKHNAMNALMIRELTDAAVQLGAEISIRAVVLAAEGKSFCAGADLSWMRDQLDRDRNGKMEESGKLATLFQTLNDLPKPLIGRIQGPAYGGGVGLMAVCDIAVAVETATFALTETRLGIIPATIGPYVVRKIGEGYARQIFYSTKTFGTDFAFRSGLISAVTNAADIDAAIEAEIEPILKTMPGAVAAAKALCLQLTDLTREHEGAVTAEALADRWENEEALERISAFLAKR
ncbi:crotonase/enoyl-CoA hydratase family protein [Rhizobium sp. L1K21]|uniref:crotonase/enoyl-CoA hydratase family protein n=1 Tax=Rhizobium sp. L1K21 TaxID=2954933 RepID=UPI002092C12B|nr:crotonase/enoyl-CoA hydratase family protein [Rhizobium sp. L1K21]MCO6187459.1 crotonase/enoyl-CoA hydratase family protein [Rhizobium sp. L1K21]